MRQLCMEIPEERRISAIYNFSAATLLSILLQ